MNGRTFDDRLAGLYRLAFHASYPLISYMYSPVFKQVYRIPDPHSKKFRHQVFLQYIFNLHTDLLAASQSGPVAFTFYICIQRQLVNDLIELITI